MTAATVTPTYSTNTFYAGPPPPPTPSTVRPEQQPPQLAYGWWVDVLPPRGPYLWPCNPIDYQITQPTQQPVKHENSNNNDDDTTTNTKHDTTADNTATAHMDTTTDSSTTPPPASFLTQPPQMAFGWYCAEPPRTGPFFWSCLPPGYQLVARSQWEQMVAGTKSSTLTTTRQGNVTLTLPTASASLAAQLAASAAAAAAASTPSPSPPPLLPSSASSLSDPLNSASPTLSLTNFYPASKTASISNLLSSPPPPPSSSTLTSDSLSFLNLSQSQDDNIGSLVLPPMPSRSPALEGLAAVAGEERGGGGSGGSSEFKLDSVMAGSGGVSGASLGSVGEADEDGGGEDEESQGGLRRGKRKRTVKSRG